MIAGVPVSDNSWCHILIGVIFHLIGDRFGKEGRVVGALLLIQVGIVKEFYDSLFPGWYADIWDIAYSILGLAIGIIICWVISLIKREG